MDEPTYTYVKGQGWVVSSCDQISGTTANGRVFTLLNRPPNIGERYVQVYKHNPTYVTDKCVVRLAQLASWLSDARPDFEYLERCTKDTNRTPADFILITLDTHLH